MSRALTDRELEVAVEMIRRAQVSGGLNGPSAKLLDLNRSRGAVGQRNSAAYQLRPGTDRRTVWAANLSNTVVSESCPCGTCPSIALALPGDTPRYAFDAERSSFILDAVAESALVLLFIENDVPVYLELVPSVGSVEVDEFPSTDSFVF